MMTSHNAKTVLTTKLSKQTHGLVVLSTEFKRSSLKKTLSKRITLTSFF